MNVFLTDTLKDNQLWQSIGITEGLNFPLSVSGNLICMRQENPLESYHLLSL